VVAEIAMPIPHPVHVGWSVATWGRLAVSSPPAHQTMKIAAFLAFTALLLSSCAMTAHEIVYVAEASGGA